MRQANTQLKIDTDLQSEPATSTSLALAEVLNAFERRDVRYCYWKSRRKLASVFAGEGDVDLLIAAQDRHRVLQILLERDFKLFPSAGDKEDAAILTFLGFDRLSGKLIHLHLHFRLIVGEAGCKNYRLPWEEELLSRAILHPEFSIRTLDAAGEALLLLVRQLLELHKLDPNSWIEWRRKTQQLDLDRRYIATIVTPMALRTLASALLTPELGDRLAKALYDERPLPENVELSRLLKKNLSAGRTCNAIEARFRSVQHFLRRCTARLNERFIHAPRTRKRRPLGGGCMIAILGVDGSGKSTSVKAMQSWLGTKVDILPLYFGTGDGRPTLVLWPFKRVLPLVTRMLKGRRRGITRSRRTPDDRSVVNSGGLQKCLLCVWALVVAHDKGSKLAAAWRGANRGLVVIADRYPQNQFPEFNDGPLLSRLDALPNWIRTLEIARVRARGKSSARSRDQADGVARHHRQA